LGLFAESAAEKGLRLVVHVPLSGSMRVVGDPIRTRQVLDNLLSNAIKFTERGEVSLELTFLAQNAETIQIEIAVRDTGIGISPDYMARLFDSFSQADNATTRKYGGSGLGLAIVKQILDVAHGQIVVESELGKGSAFRIRLTLPKADSSEESPAASPPAREFDLQRRPHSPPVENSPERAGVTTKH
jgi:two-component system sensor histidine kinase/response regulator